MRPRVTTQNVSAGLRRIVNMPVSVHRDGRRPPRDMISHASTCSVPWPAHRISALPQMNGGVLEEFRCDADAGQVLGKGEGCFCGQVYRGVRGLVPELEAAVMHSLQDIVRGCPPPAAVGHCGLERQATGRVLGPEERVEAVDVDEVRDPAGARRRGQGSLFGDTDIADGLNQQVQSPTVPWR